MPELTQHIEIHKNRDKSFRLTVTKADDESKPEDTTDWTIIMKVKKSFEATTIEFTKTSALGSTFKVWAVDDTPTDNEFIDETIDANDAGAADFEPFTYTAAEAIGDYCAFGLGSQFSKLTFDYIGGTAGVGGVAIWEYWNGTIWTALASVVDNTTNFTATAADGLTVSWAIPSGWAARIINGSASLFYVRARITTVYSTNPILDMAFVTPGQIDFVVDPDNNLWDINIVPADTVNITPDTYLFGVKGTDTNGRQRELAHGELKILPVVE